MSAQTGAEAAACLRLAFNFAPPAQRTRFLAATALRDAVLGSASTSSERQVCETQLAWWRDELERTANGNARHPLAKAFSDTPLDDNATALMREWPVAASRLIRQVAPETESQWRIAGFRTHGTVLQLSVQAADAREHVASGFRDCAIAMTWLDAPVDDAATSATLTNLGTDLATHAQGSEHVALAVLAQLLGDVISNRTQGTGGPGGIRQLVNAWRAARACRKRAFRRLNNNDD